MLNSIHAPHALNKVAVVPEPVAKVEERVPINYPELSKGDQNLGVIFNSPWKMREGIEQPVMS